MWELKRFTCGFLEYLLIFATLVWPLFLTSTAWLWCMFLCTFDFDPAEASQGKFAISAPRIRRLHDWVQIQNGDQGKSDKKARRTGNYLSLASLSCRLVRGYSGPSASSLPTGLCASFLGERGRQEGTLEIFLPSLWSCRPGSSRWLGKVSLRSFPGSRGGTKAEPARAAEWSLVVAWCLFVVVPAPEASSINSLANAPFVCFLFQINVLESNLQKAESEICRLDDMVERIRIVSELCRTLPWVAGPVLGYPRAGYPLRRLRFARPNRFAWLVRLKEAAPWENVEQLACPFHRIHKEFWAPSPFR